jgi:hypothetical protein
MHKFYKIFLLAAVYIFSSISTWANDQSEKNLPPFQLPDNVQNALSAARMSSTVGSSHFKRLAYSYANEVPGRASGQMKPSKIEVQAVGELLEFKGAPGGDYTAIAGGLVRVREPRLVSKFVSSECTETEISRLKITLPEKLNVGSSLETSYDLTSLPKSECAAPKQINERCEATKEFSAKELFPALAGRAIYLVCAVSNRLVSDRTTYKIYIEDLGIFLNSMEIECQTEKHRRYLSFDIEH